MWIINSLSSPLRFFSLPLEYHLWCLFTLLAFLLANVYVYERTYIHTFPSLFLKRKIACNIYYSVLCPLHFTVLPESILINIEMFFLHCFKPRRDSVCTWTMESSTSPAFVLLQCVLEVGLLGQKLNAYMSSLNTGEFLSIRIAPFFIPTGKAWVGLSPLWPPPKDCIVKLLECGPSVRWWVASLGRCTPNTGQLSQ